jgi:hypothetical protein
MKRWHLAASLFLSAMWPLTCALTCLGGCATGTGDTADGSADTTVPQPDGEAPDQIVQDITQPDTSRLPDSALPDTAPFDVVPPTDVAKDTATDTSLDGAADGADVGTDGGACGELGMPCSYEANNCPHPLKYECNLAYQADAGVDAGLDGSADAAALEGGLGPVNDGVCLPIFTFPKPCNDGTDHCASTVMCLNASMICLNAAETTCICDNPLTASACGPP